MLSRTHGAQAEHAGFILGPQGNRIAVDRIGPDNGLPVILMPGSGQTRHSWRRTAERLAAEGYRILSADLRGHGGSDPAPDGDYSYPRLIEDANALLRAAGGSAARVGTSIGGKTFLAAATELPASTVKCLVLVDALPRTRADGVARVSGIIEASRAGFDSPQQAAEAAARLNGRAAAPDAGERLRRNLRRNPEGRWFWHGDPRFFDSAHGLGVAPSLALLEDAAAGVAAPALLVRGEDSDFVDAEGAAALAALMPQLEVAVIAGAGRLVAGDRNDAFVAILIPFLDRHAGGNQ